MAAFKNDEIKQVIVVRTDIEMGKGKLAAQVAHASLSSYMEAVGINKKIVDNWLDSGQKKIVLKTDNVEILEKLLAAFKYKGIPSALISDAGLTQLPSGTKTALGIGPWKSEEIDKFTAALKLL
ncbi:MAG: peptidyl-tRNA hydrolase Pth2 [Candidatus Micrarchaeota archaeon]|nr:peptidyl-tRNA hydrolase Pth2 [Candidatus Micrarchaeota archaeon]MDE1847657.1 peptidyl-tRNA hydrolase Pth2 [Candidatus Micrarchaeota archaeon]MDE1864478.1 peptidyl-tRNA hydrolase Pth2 [Candidatus Micrarchaeota archaeon]